MAACLLAAALPLQLSGAAVAVAYQTNFTTIDDWFWTVDHGCFSCGAPKDPGTTYECTNNTRAALRPASGAAQVPSLPPPARKRSWHVIP